MHYIVERTAGTKKGETKEIASVCTGSESTSGVMRKKKRKKSFVLREWLPDRTFHSFRASTSADRRFLNDTKYLNRRILRLYNCEMFGQVVLQPRLCQLLPRSCHTAFLNQRKLADLLILVL